MAKEKQQSEQGSYLKNWQKYVNPNKYVFQQIKEQQDKNHKISEKDK